MRHVHARGQSGFTFAELAFAMMIMVIGAVVLINHLAVNYQTTATERDRVFAFSKAQAILSEIQGYVDRGTVDAAVDLDVLDDGVVNEDTLSIATDSVGALVPPDHVLSGNFMREGVWIWSRRITVQPFVGLNNRNVRYVTVRIYRKDKNGVDHPMADLSAVINSAGSAFPTTQVFDVYLLAIENIPGWWVFMDSIQPFVESMITDLETRNPGLNFRTHWITKSSFGRNETYRPFINDVTDTHTAMPDVYHYPGRMPTGNASTYYYVPDNIKGRVSLDGVEENGWDFDLNPHPYALADFFNNAMRYPDELALWQRRVDAVTAREQAIAAAIAGGTTVPPELADMSKEPTLRLFIEDLYSNPTKYKNAMVINLHGELLPMPALRNYADPARAPETYPTQPFRCVTHPEELRTKRNDAGVTDSLALRMYAYRADNAGTTMPCPMVVEIEGMNLTDPMSPTKLSASCTLQNLPGGTPVGGSTLYATAWLAAKHVSDPLLTGEMHYSAEFVVPGSGRTPFTRIYLVNTPVVAPLDTTNRGLGNIERALLYMMPYIPCPVATGPSFATDLRTINTATPKNTARWTLRLNPNVFTNNSFVDNTGAGYTKNDDAQLRIRTRLWCGTDPANSGTTWPPTSRNAPDNLSVTYAWWADSKEDVPITERSQFQGDPRHCPYKDLFASATEDYENGYNWYHDLLNNNTEPSYLDYPSIASGLLRNRWQSAMSCDVPRFFELLRKGVTKSACVYTTLTGFSYYYLGIGADIGYDSANGYPNSIPSHLLAYGVNGTGFLNSITGSRTFVRSVTTPYWWGIPWLGELYPDNAVATWYASGGTGPRGNLTPGTSAGQFYQGTVNSVYSASTRQAYGTAILNHHQRTSANGCTAFFNIGAATSTFHHTSSTGNGTLTPVGNELANNYNMTMPLTTPISRPFGLNWNSSTGEEFGYAPYSGASNRYSATLFKTFFTHAAGTGSGLVKLVDPGNTSASYIVVNGIDRAVESGTTFVAKWAVLSLVHSFFEAGSTTNTLRIPQLPRCEIQSPTDITELNNVTDIDIQYDVDWTRWDGMPYSVTGTFSEAENQLDYVLMYSKDGGTTWLYMEDDTVATPGIRPAAAYLEPDVAVGAEVYPWAVPAARFPEGSYLLRIDCFRRGAAVHYSFHKAKIFIQR